MRHLFIVPVLILALASCASQEETLLRACQIHDTGVRALTPQIAAGKPTQEQVDAIDQSVITADAVCDGTVVDFTSALSVLEAEALRLTIIQSTGE